MYQYHGLSILTYATIQPFVIIIYGFGILLPPKLECRSFVDFSYPIVIVMMRSEDRRISQDWDFYFCQILEHEYKNFQNDNHIGDWKLTKGQFILGHLMAECI